MIAHCRFRCRRSTFSKSAPAADRLPVSSTAARCTWDRGAPAPNPVPPVTAAAARSRPITDANLLLGRLGADRFLGGEMKLDLAAAERAHAAAGRRAARAERDRRGQRHLAHRRYQDVLCGQRRDHGARARRRQLSPWSPMAARVRCMPPRLRVKSAFARSSSRGRPGHFSAFGMLFADLRYDYVRTWFTSAR